MMQDDYHKRMREITAECHAHLALNGEDFARAKSDNSQGPQEGLIRGFFEEYRTRGITFVRDGGDAWGVSELAASLAPEFGIDYRTPVFAIHRNGCYGGIVGRGFDTLREYAALVDEAASRGADFIKIMTTGIMDFAQFGVIRGGTGLPLDDVREMVHIAHEQGFAIMAHINGAQAVLDAVEAGVDSIEHGNYIDDECIAALSQSRTCLVPTATVARNLIGSGISDDEVLTRIWDQSRETIVKAADAGVILACGSDAGAVGVLHGKGMFDEYQCFVDALGDEQRAADILSSGASFIRSTFKRA